jgi:hypothetical protein
MTALEAYKLATIKITMMAVITVLLNALGVVFGELAHITFEILHWLFKMLQCGANIGTLGTFMLAFYKHLYPRQSVRTHVSYLIFKIGNFFKRKKK